MSKWIEFSRRGSGETIYIKSEIVGFVSPRGNGSKLGLSCDFESLEVAETPEEVLAKLGEKL